MHLFGATRARGSRALAALTAVVALVGVFALPGSAAAATTTTTVDVNAYTARVVQLTNNERAKVGLGPLSSNTALANAATSYAGVLGTDACFAHNCPPVTDLYTRLVNAGYSFSGYRSWSYGENIAAGYSTPDSVVAGWMASSGHRANILNSSYTDIGVGLVVKPAGTSKYTYYWVQDFGGRH